DAYVAALAQPSLPIKSQKSHQTPALNLHSLTPPPVRTPPRFPPSRPFGRLPPCLPSRLRLAGIRKPLTGRAVPNAKLSDREGLIAAVSLSFRDSRSADCAPGQTVRSLAPDPA